MVRCVGIRAGAASVLSKKFIEEKNADPSTTIVAKNAPNFAQDDRFSVNRINDSEN
jgi:hypothetical protein